jgi:glutathione S-transferase
MKLYALPGSASLASHIALEVVRDASPTELPPLSIVLLGREENLGAAYRAINPSGTVPALQLEDGRILTESLAVLLWIADRFPASGLAGGIGTPERDRVHTLLSTMVTSAHSAFQMYRRTERYVDTPHGQDSVRHLALQRLAGLLAHFEGQVKDSGLLVGEQVTVADIMLFVVARWGMSLPHGTQHYPRLWDFTQRMAAVPATVRAMATEGISMAVPCNGLG